MNRRVQFERVAGMGNVFLNTDFIEAIATQSAISGEIQVVMSSGARWEVVGTPTEAFRKIDRVRAK